MRKLNLMLTPEEALPFVFVAQQSSHEQAQVDCDTDCSASIICVSVCFNYFSTFKYDVAYRERICDQNKSVTHFK